MNNNKLLDYIVHNCSDPEYFNVTNYYPERMANYVLVIYYFLINTSI